MLPLKFINNLLPLFKKLIIEDDTGYWDAYVESRLNKPIREIIDFPEIRESEVISGHLILPSYASDADAEFWHVDMDNTDPFYENSLYLHAPTIRNRLGYDLSNGTRYAFVAEDLVMNLNKEGFLAYDTEYYQMYSYQYFRDLAKVWAWKISEGKPTNIRRNRCSDFSLALYNGIQGGEKDGFSSKNHREASIALDKLFQNGGPASPPRSMEVLYGLLEFCKLKKNEFSLNFSKAR
jgi:hypothetical protein